MRKYAAAWWANYTWLISRTPGLRDLLKFAAARGEFDYRRVTW